MLAGHSGSFKWRKRGRKEKKCFYFTSVAAALTKSNLEEREFVLARNARLPSVTMVAETRWQELEAAVDVTSTVKEHREAKVCLSNDHLALCPYTVTTFRLGPPMSIKAINVFPHRPA